MMANHVPKAKKQIVTKYQPSAKELKQMDSAKARSNAAPVHIRLKREKVDGGVASVSFDHKDQLVAQTLFSEALGVTDPLLINQAIKDAFAAIPKGKELDLDALNGVLAIIQGIKPQDEVEAVLASQMAAVHTASMRQAAFLANADTTDQVAVFSNALNKLNRTFVAQIEALKSYRSPKGQQRVVVEHRHYHLHQPTPGDGGATKNRGQPLENGQIGSKPQGETMQGDVKEKR